MNLFSPSSLEGGLTLGDNIGGNIAPSSVSITTIRKGQPWKGMREARASGNLTKGRDESRGEDRREKIEKLEGIAEKGQMPWRIFPLFVERRTNNSPLVSGFYNWPEVVQLRKRDAGRPRRESSFAPPSLSSFLLYVPSLFLPFSNVFCVTGPLRPAMISRFRSRNFRISNYVLSNEIERILGGNLFATRNFLKSSWKQC